MRVITDMYPKIERNQVYKRLGYQPGTEPSSSTQAKIDKYLERTTQIITPKVIYTGRSIKAVEGNRVHLDDHQPPLNSHKISQTLKKSKKIIFFITTLGKKIDNEIRKLMHRGRMSDAYILDTMGSAAAERLTQTFQEQFGKSMCPQGMRTTLRFSPGYCDWNIKEQEKIFSVLDSSSIGVHLTPKYMMVPRKSVSGIFGIEHGESASKKPFNPCDHCAMKHCSMRRKS